MTPAAKLFEECVANTPEDVKMRVEWSFQIADKIASTLKEMGITQKEFARRVGRSEAEVSRWVGGTHNFTLSTLALISSTIGVPLLTVTRSTLTTNFQIYGTKTIRTTV